MFLSCRTWVCFTTDTWGPAAHIETTLTKCLVWWLCRRPAVDSWDLLTSWLLSEFHKKISVVLVAVTAVVGISPLEIRRLLFSVVVGASQTDLRRRRCKWKLLAESHHRDPLFTRRSCCRSFTNRSPASSLQVAPVELLSVTRLGQVSEFHILRRRRHCNWKLLPKFGCCRSRTVYLRRLCT